MYYPSSENKGADQLRGYREADLHLCFRICRLLVFSRGGSNSFMLKESNIIDVEDERHFVMECTSHLILKKFLVGLLFFWLNAMEVIWRWTLV